MQIRFMRSYQMSCFSCREFTNASLQQWLQLTGLKYLLYNILYSKVLLAVSLINAVLEQEIYCLDTIYFSKFQERRYCILATPFRFVKDEISSFRIDNLLYTCLIGTIRKEI